MPVTKEKDPFEYIEGQGPIRPTDNPYTNPASGPIVSMSSANNPEGDDVNEEETNFIDATAAKYKPDASFSRNPAQQARFDKRTEAARDRQTFRAERIGERAALQESKRNDRKLDREWNRKVRKGLIPTDETGKPISKSNYGSSKHSEKYLRPVDAGSVDNNKTSANTVNNNNTTQQIAQGTNWFDAPQQNTTSERDYPEIQTSSSGKLSTTPKVDDTGASTESEEELIRLYGDK